MLRFHPEPPYNLRMVMLDVSLGIVVYFLLLSLIATAIVEAIASALRARGRVLRRAIDATTDGGREFVDALYRHPLIYALYEAPKKEIGENSRLSLPAYIPADSFSRAFVETAVGQPLEEAEDLQALFESPTRSWKHPKEGEGLPPQALDDVYAALRPLVLQSGGDTTRLLALVGRQFERVNDRARGWYKRWVGKWLLGIGFALAVLSHGDAFRILHRLQTDPVTRAAWVALAESDIKPEDSDRAKQLERVAAVEGLSGSWSDDPEWKGKTIKERAGTFLGKLPGLLVTAFAVSLGAPFWFDLLNKLVSLRSSLAPKAADGGDPSKPKSEGEALQAASAAPSNRSPALTRERAATFETLSGLAMASYEPRGSFLDWLRKSDGLAQAEVVEFSVNRSMPLESAGSPGAPAAQLRVDTQARLVIAPGHLVVVFRGTEPTVLSDLVTDARFKPSAVDWFGGAESEAQVHRGFKAALDAVWPELEERLLAALVSKEGSLSFTGHSLGGALAVLAAVRLLAKAPVELRQRIALVHTVGQPRVGNAAFAAAAERLLEGRYFRAVNHRDAVPRIPPAKLGAWEYQHFGTVHYFDSARRLWINPGVLTRLADAAIPETEIAGVLKTTYQHHAADAYLGAYRQVLAATVMV